MASTCAAVTVIQHVGNTGMARKAYLPSILSNHKLHIRVPCKINPDFTFSGYKSWSKAGARLPKSCISAVLEKPSSSGRDSTDPALASLERLYRQNAGSANSFGASGNGSLDLAVSSLDRNVAIQDLRKKEEELKVAEKAAEEDGKEVQSAQSALVNGEKDLKVAVSDHKERREEIVLLRNQLTMQSKELKETKRMVKLQLREVRVSQDQLTKKQAELRSLKVNLSEKDQALSDLRLEIKSRESQLLVATSVISQQSSDIDKLRSCVKKKENELRRSEEERFLKQEKLLRTEADLEKRVVAYLSAREEFKVLSNDAALYEKRGLAFEQELEQARSLLFDVRKELEMSQKVIASYRQEAEEKEMQTRKQHEELASQLFLLNSYTASLQDAKTELEEEREHVRLLKGSSEQLEQTLLENKSFVKDLHLQLDKEKASLQSSVLEVNSLRKELQQQESVVSDNQLFLQLKEAELISVKLEMQEIRSELTSMRILLNERGQELESARKMVEELQKEVSHLRACLNLEEERYMSATILLKERDKELDVMKLDLDENKVKLSEATTVVEQIAKLSRFLAEFSIGGKSSHSHESSILMDTNYELFSANRALLEKEFELQQLHEKSLQGSLKQQELETELIELRGCLQQKDTELQAVHRALVNKDNEFKQLQAKWEAREAELNKMREDVIEEAKGLTSLHVLAQTPGKNGQKCPGVVAVEKLELEVSKLEIEAAKCALQKLAELSFELLEDGQQYQSSAFDANDRFKSSLGRNNQSLLADIGGHRANDMNDSSGFSSSLVVADLDNLKVKLEERDEVLGHTKKAMANLLKMTRVFLVEAGVNIERPFNHAYSS